MRKQVEGRSRKESIKEKRGHFFFPKKLNLERIAYITYPKKLILYEKWTNNVSELIYNNTLPSHRVVLLKNIFSRIREQHI